MSGLFKKLLARLAWRERCNEAHGAIVETGNGIVGTLRRFIRCRAPHFVQRGFRSLHETLQKRLRRTGQARCADQQLALDGLKHDGARAQVAQVHVIPRIGNHVDPSHVNWPGWAAIDPATIAPRLRHASAAPVTEAAE